VLKALSSPFLSFAKSVCIARRVLSSAGEVFKVKEGENRTRGKLGGGVERVMKFG